MATAPSPSPPSPCTVEAEDSPSPSAPTRASAAHSPPFSSHEHAAAGLYHGHSHSHSHTSRPLCVHAGEPTASAFSGKGSFDLTPINWERYFDQRRMVHIPPHVATLPPQPAAVSNVSLHTRGLCSFPGFTFALACCPPFFSFQLRGCDGEQAKASTRERARNLTSSLLDWLCGCMCVMLSTGILCVHRWPSVPLAFRSFLGSQQRSSPFPRRAAAWVRIATGEQEERGDEGARERGRLQRLVSHFLLLFFILMFSFLSDLFFCFFHFLFLLLLLSPSVSGGHTSLAWACVASYLKHSMAVLSFDLRGHGSTHTSDDADLVSGETGVRANRI